MFFSMHISFPLKMSLLWQRIKYKLPVWQLSMTLSICLQYLFHTKGNYWDLIAQLRFKGLKFYQVNEMDSLSTILISVLGIHSQKIKRFHHLIGSSKCQISCQIFWRSKVPKSTYYSLIFTDFTNHFSFLLIESKFCCRWLSDFSLDPKIMVFSTKIKILRFCI